MCHDQESRAPSIMVRRLDAGHDVQSWISAKLTVDRNTLRTSRSWSATRLPSWVASAVYPGASGGHCLTQFVEAWGDGHSSGFLWWPVEEQCSFAPSPDLRLEML